MHLYTQQYICVLDLLSENTLCSTHKNSSLIVSIFAKTSLLILLNIIWSIIIFVFWCILWPFNAFKKILRRTIALSSIECIGLSVVDTTKCNFFLQSQLSKNQKLLFSFSWNKQINKKRKKTRIFCLIFKIDWKKVIESSVLSLTRLSIYAIFHKFLCDYVNSNWLNIFKQVNQ